MPTFLFHHMGQILLRPAILWVSAQQNSCKRNVGKALPVMNGIGMAGECSQESENNAQTKAKNVPDTPRQSGTLDCKPTEQRADWCAEREVWAWSRWRKTLHILFLISSLHADMRRSEQTEMTPDSVSFMSCSLIRLSYVFCMSDDEPFGISGYRKVGKRDIDKPWAGVLYYTEFTYYIYYTHFWADIGLHEIMRNHELEFSILYRMYILHILYPLLSRYWYAVSWITPSPALISMWHFSRRPIWHFWSQKQALEKPWYLYLREEILEYRVLFCILPSIELQGTVLKTTNFSFLEIKKFKKRSGETICSLCRCNCCVSSHCIGGLALGGWDMRKWWALLRRWWTPRRWLCLALQWWWTPTKVRPWGWWWTPGVGGVWPWGGGEPRLRSVLGGGGEPPRCLAWRQSKFWKDSHWKIAVSRFFERDIPIHANICQSGQGCEILCWEEFFSEPTQLLEIKSCQVAAPFTPVQPTRRGTQRPDPPPKRRRIRRIPVDTSDLPEQIAQAPGTTVCWLSFFLWGILEKSSLGKVLKSILGAAMKHTSSRHCCCQASLSAVSADEHMSEARAMRLENKWVEMRSHAQMALLTPNSPEVAHEAYLFLAEADFHMSRFAAAKEHLAWYLSEKPTCPNGLQLKADLEGHEVEGDEDSADDKEQHLPMSHEAAEAAAQEIMAMPPVLDTTERAEAVASVEAPLHGGQRSCMISVSVPISSTFKALLEKARSVTWSWCSHLSLQQRKSHAGSFEKRWGSAACWNGCKGSQSKDIASARALAKRVANSKESVRPIDQGYDLRLRFRFLL